MLIADTLEIKRYENSVNNYMAINLKLKWTNS